MADFSQAYKITMSNEGGYAHQQNDSGGETWRGIARNFWPEWAGWTIVDAANAQHPKNLNQVLGNNGKLEQLVLAFYKTEFWDSLSLQAIKNQKLANQLFDISVNMGTGTAAKLLQMALNTFPNNSLIVDHIIGRATITATNNSDQKSLYEKINELRKELYNQIIVNNPSQAVFKDGWMARIKPFGNNRQSLA